MIRGTTTIDMTLEWNSHSELSYALVNGMTLVPKPVMPEPKPLGDGEWAALEAAERPLYTPHMGCHGYTDVMPQNESGQIRYIWDQARGAVEAEHDRWEHLGFSVQNGLTAARVARTLAVLNFGQEFLLK